MTTFLYTLTGATRIQKEKKNSLLSVYKSRMLLKKNLGFRIWIYVFGFNQCNGLIIRSSNLVLPN